jgi:hypothetical protein
VGGDVFWELVGLDGRCRRPSLQDATRDAGPVALKLLGLQSLSFLSLSFAQNLSPKNAGFVIDRLWNEIEIDSGCQQ